MTALFHWKVTNGYKLALISRQRHTQSFADIGCSRLYSISRCSLFLWLPIRQTALPACGQIRLEHQCCRLMGQQARPGVHCFITAPRWMFWVVLSRICRVGAGPDPERGRLKCCYLDQHMKWLLRDCEQSALCLTGWRLGRTQGVSFCCFPSS